jgi:RNA polymerase sigma-70 factor (ECF subfamily)
MGPSCVKHYVDSFTSVVGDLYASHEGWLKSWLRKRLGSAFDAADLAQETFVRVLIKRRIEVEEGLKTPRAYLSTIAHGLVVDLWRRRALEQAWCEVLRHLPEAEAPSPDMQFELWQALTEIDALLISAADGR